MAKKIIVSQYGYGDDNSFRYECSCSNNVPFSRVAGWFNFTVNGDTVTINNVSSYSSTSARTATLTPSVNGTACTDNMITIIQGNYLEFVPSASSTFKFSGNSVEYSIDSGQTWVSLANNTNSPTVAAGNSILWRGNLTPSGLSGIGAFSSTSNFVAKGNPLSLLRKDDFPSVTAIPNYAFRNLFSGCTTLTNAENLTLSATSIGKQSCGGMFQHCTNLTAVPRLNVDALGESCCAGMFWGCTNLTTLPANMLPSTSLNSYCYTTMFKDCTNLTTVPSDLLPADSLDEYCYSSMFGGCTSLVTAPILSATSLAEACYSSMFNNCRSLESLATNRIELPATDLYPYCYRMMFAGCNSTSFEAAPILEAETLEEYCYSGMFQNCDNLHHIICLATDISAEGATRSWVLGVSSNGTFVKAASMNDWTLGDSGIPSRWLIQNA